jgi:hypothetical protein
MNQHRATTHRIPPRAGVKPVRTVLVAMAAASTLLLSACSGSSSSAPSVGSASAPAGGAQVVPVTSNPISNTATAKTLAIDKVMVENNTDSSGATVNDHLQLDLHNSGTTPLSGVEVFYTFADPTSSAKESYYLKLPATFTVPAGGTRTIHFDNTGAPDHFPVNKFSLYATSTAALQVTVEVSATGAAPVTATAKKDPGGSENAGG